GQPAAYAIPSDNPFADAVAHPDDCAEIFHWGFRNPFRFSFDRDTGDILIGDVGQNRYEEISFLAAGSGGKNFQWNACEGFHTYPGNAAGCAGPAGSIPPKIELPHNASPFACAIIGGYMYRGPIVPLRGQYLFSDNCTGEIYVAGDPDPSAPSWSYDVLDDEAPGAYSFGEDEDGNVYVARSGGQVYICASAETATTWRVTPCAGIGGARDPSTPQTVDDGDSVAFEVIADPGHSIDSVTG